MKRTIALISVLVAVILASGIAGSCQPGVTPQNNDTLISPALPLQSCTIFTASFGDTVLFGNNEDNGLATGFLQIYPSSEENYGVLTLNWNSVTMGGIEGGINDKGLCWDGNALPASTLKAHPELPPPPPSDGGSVVSILQKYATVEEVITIFETASQSYNMGGLTMEGQSHFADATGDAVVISIGADGEFAFTRKQKGDGYLVSTNFNPANPSNHLAYPCWRYNTATAMLAKIKSQKDLTVDYFRSILDAVHVENSTMANTVYSNIFDLCNGIMYLYFFHQFDDVVTINIADETAKGEHTVDLAGLFSPETIAKAIADFSEVTEEEVAKELDRLLSYLSDEEETVPPTGSLDWRILTAIIAGSVVLLSATGFFTFRIIKSRRRGNSISTEQESP